MRILVTGAGGFVGRELARDLATRHQVVALDRACVARPGVEIVEGDLTDPAIVAQAVEGGCDALVHLATVPGGASEQDPALAWRVNVEASATLFDAVRRAGRQPRIVYASSIAALGDPLPDPVTDDTPLRPRMLYGAHKAMIEQWLGALSRRGEVDGLSLRLSGIVARPRGSSGLKSAFMSDIFHAALAGERFTVPVSPGATMWMMSVRQIALNLSHAVETRTVTGDTYVATLPAVRATMVELAAEIARQVGSDPGMVSYAPDAGLEAMFGRYPALEVHRAKTLGFADDGSLAALVESALTTIRQGD